MCESKLKREMLFLLLGIKYVSNSEENPEEKKLLPCFTFCPLPPFKTDDLSLSYTRKAYKENTFKLNDVFSDETVKILKNATEFAITETESVILGVCQTICKLQKVEAFDFSFSLQMRRSWDVNIYFHSKGSELWFLFSPVVLDSQFVTLLTQNDKGLIAADLSISETQTTVLNKKGMPCRHYTIDVENHNQNVDYLDCQKKKTWSKLRPKINCTIAGMSSLSDNDFAEMEECKDDESAWHTRAPLSEIAVQSLKYPSKFGCDPPCKSISYIFSKLYYHQHSMHKEYYNTKDGIFFLLSIYYKTLMVEERTETLIYDVPGLLSAAGGNLGLMLGFSCLSVLFGAIQCLSKLFVILHSALK